MTKVSPERIRSKFLSKVYVDPDNHWLWTDTLQPSGYGIFYFPSVDRKRTRGYAHRVSHELFKGPIPAGLEIDHLCRVRHCVNPQHLEAVDKVENIARGESPPAHNARKTHCIRGHEFNTANTYLRPDGGGRVCMPCHWIRHKKRKARSTATA